MIRIAKFNLGIINSLQIIFIALLIFLFLCSCKIYAQWAYTYGSSNNEVPYCVIQGSDGGYLAVGYSNSFGSGGYDYWLNKLDNTGSLTWQKLFSTAQTDIAYSVLQTIDGGYLIAGESAIMSAPNSDILLIKTDSSGNSIWQTLYRSGYPSKFGDIQQTSDDGYILIGSTLTNVSTSDVWVIKLNSTGNVAWQNVYNLGDNEYGRAIRQTSDGGYIIAADALYNFSEYSNIWVIKLTSTGNVSWQLTYGIGDEHANVIKQTSDGGYIVGGTTTNYGAGNKDIWLLKLNANGYSTWQKTYGGFMDDVIYSLQQNSDGGYIFAGYTDSAEPDNRDAIVVKLDPNGNILWQKRYGGSYQEEATSIHPTNDGGFIIGMHTYSYGSGSSDFLIIKTDSSGNIDPSCSLVNNLNLTTFNTSNSPTSLSYFYYSPAINTYPMNIASSDTTADEINICSASPGAVPDNDNYPGIPLTIAKNGTNTLRLSWGAPSAPCHTTDYSIYNGSLPFTNYNHSYLLCSTGNTTSTDIEADTESYYYLVVAQYGKLEGSYGVDSSNNQRPTGVISCYYQHIGSCN